MPDFQYTAREMSGQMVTGVLQAGSRQEALAALDTRQLFPVNVDLAEDAKAQAARKGKRVKPLQLANFYGQLADLLTAGVPLLKSLELLENQATSSSLKVVIQDVREQVADGTRLAEAMRAHPRVFSELVVSMVRAGEEGSFLEDVLKRIAGFTEHQEDLKSRVIGTLVYPVFVLVVGSLVVTVMLIWFVPKFEHIFERMSERGSLPWTTSTLLGMSGFMQKYWIVMALVIAAGIFYLRTLFQSEEGRQRYDEWRLKVYGFGKIVRSLAIARFCRILGTLLANGVPILQSLRISKDATGNRVLSDAIADASDNISAGKSLAKPLSASGEFPQEIVEMIAVGEEANNLENVLIDIAGALERRTNREIEMAVRLLEPILLLFIAMIVLFVVAALLLPILNSSSTI